MSSIPALVPLGFLLVPWLGVAKSSRQLLLYFGVVGSKSGTLKPAESSRHQMVPLVCWPNGACSGEIC